MTEGLSGALVGVITVKDTQLNTLSVELLDNLDSAFEVNPTIVVKRKLAFDCVQIRHEYQVLLTH